MIRASWLRELQYRVYRRGLLLLEGLPSFCQQLFLRLEHAKALLAQNLHVAASTMVRSPFCRASSFVQHLPTRFVVLQQLRHKRESVLMVSGGAARGSVRSGCRSGGSPPPECFLHHLVVSALHVASQDETGLVGPRLRKIPLRVRLVQLG